MATRTPTRPRGTAKQAARTPAGRKPAARKPAARKPAARKKPARVGPPWPVRALRGLWLGIAHLVGALARRIGSTRPRPRPGAPARRHRPDAARPGDHRRPRSSGGTCRAPSAGSCTPSSPAPSAGSAWCCRWSCSASGSASCGTRRTPRPAAGSASGSAPSCSRSSAWCTSPGACPTPSKHDELREAGGYLGFLVSLPAGRGRHDVRRGAAARAADALRPARGHRHPAARPARPGQGGPRLADAPPDRGGARSRRRDDRRHRRHGRRSSRSSR